MKKIICFILLLTLIGNATAEEDPSPFSEQYGLQDYYDILKEKNGGLFRNWSPENKAQFYEMIPALVQMEEERIHNINKEWSPDVTFLISIMAQPYIFPDEKMINQADAIRMATQRAIDCHFISAENLGNYIITISCVKMSIEPEWSIGFYEKERNYK